MVAWDLDLAEYTGQRPRLTFRNVVPEGAGFGWIQSVIQCIAAVQCGLARMPQTLVVRSRRVGQGVPTGGWIQATPCNIRLFVSRNCIASAIGDPRYGLC